MRYLIALLVVLGLAACSDGGVGDTYAIEHNAAMWQCSEKDTLNVREEPVREEEWNVVFVVEDGPLEGQMILVSKDMPAFKQKAFATCPGDRDAKGRIWDGSGQWAGAPTPTQRQSSPTTYHGQEDGSNYGVETDE